MLPSPAPDKYILSMILEELEIVWNYLEDLPTSTKPKKSKEYVIKYFGDSTKTLLVFVAVMVASEVPRLNEANKSTVVHSICLHNLISPLEDNEIIYFWSCDKSKAVIFS